ncbi:MAG TPA: SusE domain-containing protein [Ferruginibacter sp.]|nr:SusE domain-containing protein [Ferruginibacter sp.]
MKHIFKISSFILAIAMIFSACKKVDDLPVYNNGSAVSLSSSVSAVAAQAADSNNVVVSFSWSNPNYAQDSSKYKYVLEIDSTGRGFTNAFKTVFTGVYSGSLTGKQLNDGLLSLGFAFNTAYDVDVRLSSSYGNNNEKYYSNTIKMSMTPYKIPPKIPVPAALYLVGDINGWNNSPSLDTKYQFSLIDETTYAGIFNFSGGAYKLIQELGNWGTQFHMVTGGTQNAGEFVQADADPAFPAPASGWYRVTVNFQNGTYKLTPAPARVPTPANLYIVGELNGWNNSPSLDPIYHFTNPSAFVRTLDLDITGGGIFKLIQELGNWGTQFHQVSGTPAFGEFEQRDADPAFSLPSAAGRYRIKVDFAANYYWITRI